MEWVSFRLAIATADRRLLVDFLALGPGPPLGVD
jgi:hypothetical protein